MEVEVKNIKKTDSGCTIKVDMHIESWDKAVKVAKELEKRLANYLNNQKTLMD